VSNELFFVRLCLVAGLALLGFNLYSGGKGVFDAHHVIRVNESLRRLSALTIRNFPDRNLSEGKEFWNAIGRAENPMRDVWGSEFRLESKVKEGKKEFFWRSAGADREYHSPDDIVVQVPFPEGLGFGQDPGPFDNVVMPPTSTNAR